MAEIPSIPTNTSVEKLFTELMPSIAKEMLAESGAAADLSGTEITMTVEVDGDKYSYFVKDGSEFKYVEGDQDSPMLRMKVSGDDIKKMIETENLDMILGIQNDLNRSKYNAISSLKGSFTALVDNDDGSTFTIEAVLNNAQQPNASFRMSAADTTALMKKETNPVNLFMSGAMKIDGDMSFAMATQPLFT